jgi:hypothetical protein
MLNGSFSILLEGTDDWAGTLTAIPNIGRNYASTATYNNKARVFGGDDSAGNFLNDCWTWEWLGLFWNEANPLPSFGRRGGMMASLNGQLIYSTGLSGSLERLTRTWTTAMPVAVNNHDEGAGILLFPNPGTDHFAVQGAVGSIVQLRFFSLDGKLCYATQTASSTLVTTDHLPKGMYLIEINTAQGIVKRSKWVKH